MKIRICCNLYLLNISWYRPNLNDMYRKLKRIIPLLCVYCGIKLILSYQRSSIDVVNDHFHKRDEEFKTYRAVAMKKLDMNITSFTQKYSNKLSVKSKEFDKPHIRKHFQNLVTQEVDLKISCETHGINSAGNLFSDDIFNAFENYTFDDPMLYKGFTIDAWPPSKDRNVSNYITDPFTRLPNIDHFKDKELLIVVQSRPSEKDLRMMWRHFIGQYSNNRTSIIFLFGSQVGLNSNSKMLLTEEMHEHDDIALIDGLIEHYHNLTLKSLYSLKLFLNDAWHPDPPKYMLKIDVDVFVNIPKLFQEIVHNPELENIQKFILGDCNRCDPIKHRAYRISPPAFYHMLSEKHQQAIKRNPSSKWVIPSYMYNKDTFPTFITGPAYLISRASAKCMIEKAKNVPFLTLEDVYITGFLAQECDIKRFNHPGFYAVAKEFDFEKDITNHLDYSSCVHYTDDIIGCSFDRLMSIRNAIDLKPNC